MRQTGVMTSNGRVTIPLKIRRALGLRAGDRVTFDLVGDEVRIGGLSSVVERTAGIVKGSEPPQSAEHLRENAEWAIVLDVIERSG